MEPTETNIDTAAQPAGQPAAQPEAAAPAGQPAGQPEGQPAGNQLEVNSPNLLDGAATDKPEGEQADPKTDQKPEDGKQPDDKKPGDKPEEKTGAPETYEFKSPEGIVLSDSVMDAFKGVAKDLNLPQDAAQKVIDTIAPKMAEQQVQQLETLSNGWIEASKNDKEFGGEKFNQTLTVAKKALDTYGTPELTQLLNNSKLGNNPEVIRFFSRVGATLKEDSVVTGKQGKETGNQFTRAANTLYPQN